jgi:hypothetical protein
MAGRSIKLPMPVALAAAFILGSLSLMKAKRPVYYTVEEGDSLCAIGECFNRDALDVYNLNRNIVTDPDLIYPGDRYALSATHQRAQ